ncbi:MAG: HmuY family protein, partial [Candidatus Micrarchaeota archaeon]
AAFYAWGELTDPTDLEGFTAQPGDAPLFPDVPSSVMTDWYNYNGMTHQLTSKSHVYLLKTGGAVYKMRIESYYKNMGGVPTSGYYSFVWKEL